MLGFRKDGSRQAHGKAYALLCAWSFSLVLVDLFRQPQAKLASYLPYFSDIFFELHHSFE
jgi:hypothetical protein